MVDRIGQQFGRLGDQGIERHCRALWGVLTCQGEEGAHQARATLSGSRHLVNQFEQGTMAEFFP